MAVFQTINKFLLAFNVKNPRRFKLLNEAFLFSASIILLLTAALKLFAIVDKNPLLSTSDPLFAFFTNRQMLLIAASLEIIVSIIAFRRASGRTAFRLKTIVWLSILLVLYRVGVSIIGTHKPCSCLGEAAKIFGIDDTTTFALTLGILLYLLAGSLLLLLTGKQRNILQLRDNSAHFVT